MKTLLRIVGRLMIGGILLLVIGMVYSTVKGHTTWYFRVNGHVTIDGHATSGYLHANTQRTILLLTRTDGSRPETYLVPLRDKREIWDCGDWSPTRFWPVVAGDGMPPYFIGDRAAGPDAPVNATLVFRRTSVEFSTTSGKRVKAEW